MDEVPPIHAARLPAFLPCSTVSSNFVVISRLSVRAHSRIIASVSTALLEGVIQQLLAAFLLPGQAIDRQW